MKKALLGFVVFGALLIASSASALTVQEVLDLKAAGFTTDQIVTMFGSTGSTGGSTVTSYGYTHAMTLKQGSTGAYVSALQNALGITADGVFGPMTKAAVMAFQTSKGLVADGVVGPMTGAALQSASMVSTPSTGGSSSSSSSTTLSGGAGQLEDVDLMSEFSNEDAGEGDEVEVLGLELEADEGSDLDLQNVRVVFDHAGGTENGTSSTRFDRYADEVIIMLDGEEVGSVDAADFNRDSSGVYSKTIALDGAMIEAGDTAELTVAVAVVNNLDSDDEGEEWSVTVSSIRYRDAAGAVITDSSTGDLATPATEIFSFESLSSASDVELRLNLASNNPDSTVVDISATSTTGDVELMQFTMKAKGSDLWVDEIPVLFTSTVNNMELVVSKAKLKIGSKVYTENVTGGALTETVTFDNLDYDLEEGDTVTVTVLADIRGANSLTEGATLTASIGTAQRNAILVEDSNGDDLANGDKVGSPSGEAMAFYDDGVNISLYSATATRSYALDPQAAADEDEGTFTVVFDVEAFGEDMYIDKPVDGLVDANAAGQGVEFDVLKDGVIVADGSIATTYDILSTLLTANGTEADDNANVWHVRDGQTRRFTLTVVLSPDDADAGDDTGNYEVVLQSINWGTSTAAATNANYYTFNLDEFKTGSVYLRENA